MSASAIREHVNSLDGAKSYKAASDGNQTAAGASHELGDDRDRVGVPVEMRLGAQNIREEAQRNVEHVLDLQQWAFQCELAGIYLRDWAADRENDVFDPICVTMRLPERSNASPSASIVRRTGT